MDGLIILATQSQKVLQEFGCMTDICFIGPAALKGLICVSVWEINTADPGTIKSAGGIKVAIPPDVLNSQKRRNW